MESILKVRSKYNETVAE